MQTLIDTTIDGHVHTRRCGHAVGEMVEYVEQAVACGLRVITFLEHLEAAINYQPRSWLEAEDFDDYFAEGLRLRERFRGVIEVRLGVETGYNPAAADAVRARLARYPWDRVGLSCHFHAHEGSHLNLLSRRQQSLDTFAAIGVDRVLSRYFEALIAAVREIDCDVLCHLDAALRHYPGLQFNQSHRQQIVDLLDAVQERGVALEINTSGFDYRGTPFPAAWIITRALERGIPLSAGSDAHRPADVGRYFDRLPAYLASLAA